MTLRTAHGAAKGRLAVVEVCPADELPEGVQAPQHVPTGSERDEHGRWRAGARTSQARGGRSKKARTRLAASLGLSDLAEAGEFAPFLDQANEWARATITHLSEQIGGGEVGPDVGAIVQTAAGQLAASRFLLTMAIKQGGDPGLLASSSRLGDSSRQNTLTAFEIASRTAKGRPLVPPSLYTDVTGGDE
jgi:hypothetical protein